MERRVPIPHTKSETWWALKRPSGRWATSALGNLLLFPTEAEAENKADLIEYYSNCIPAPVSITHG